MSQPAFGIVTTIITPFNKDLSIDFFSLRNEINAAINAGSVGFLVPCLASEINELTLKERIQIVKATIETVSGRAQVIASINADTQGERLELLDCFLKLGVDGINVILPYQDDKKFLRELGEINSYKPPFLFLQDVDDYGDGLADNLIIEAYHKFDSLVGVKVEVKNNNPKYTRLLQKTNNRLIIASGSGNDQLIELLDRGVQIVMPSGLFKIFNSIYFLYHNHQRNRARHLFYKALPIISHTRQTGAINRHFHKQYFQQLGIFKTSLLREKAYYDKENERYAKELLTLATEIDAHINEY